MEFDLGFGRSGRPRDETEPMRLLVLGDFSGKAVAERAPLAGRPAQRVDIDNFDDVMRRLAPRVSVPAGEIRFEQIDDFTPIGCTPGSTCSRRCARRAPGRRQAATICSGACSANPPSPARHLPRPKAGSPG
jgi:hypothetical protein